MKPAELEALEAEADAVFREFGEPIEGGHLFPAWVDDNVEAAFLNACDHIYRGTATPAHAWAVRDFAAMLKRHTAKAAV